MIPDSVTGLRAVMADQDYVLSDGLAVSLFLALRKQRPLSLKARPALARPRLRRRCRRCLAPSDPPAMP